MRYGRNEKAAVTGIQNAEHLASNIVSKSLALAESSESARAEPKVDKKRGECVLFVYWMVQIQGARARK